MTAFTQSSRRKLSLLKFAEELGNVSKACQIMGYHRDTFYEVKRAFQMGGVASLVEQKRGPRGPHPNRVTPEEQQVLAYSLNKPTHGGRNESPTNCALECRCQSLRRQGCPAEEQSGNPLQTTDASGRTCPQRHLRSLRAPCRVFASWRVAQP